MGGNSKEHCLVNIWRLAEWDNACQQSFSKEYGLAPFLLANSGRGMDKLLWVQPSLRIDRLSGSQWTEELTVQNAFPIQNAHTKHRRVPVFGLTKGEVTRVAYSSLS